eukprot:EG_transcript_24231
MKSIRNATLSSSYQQLGLSRPQPPQWAPDHVARAAVLRMGGAHGSGFVVVGFAALELAGEAMTVVVEVVASEMAGYWKWNWAAPVLDVDVVKPTTFPAVTLLGSPPGWLGFPSHEPQPPAPDIPFPLRNWRFLPFAQVPQEIAHHIHAVEDCEQ